MLPVMETCRVKWVDFPNCVAAFEHCRLLLYNCLLHHLLLSLFPGAAVVAVFAFAVADVLGAAVVYVAAALIAAASFDLAVLFGALHDVDIVADLVVGCMVLAVAAGWT